MAITVTLKERRRLGNAYMNILDVALDDSYPTGGEAITARQLGLNVVDFVLPSPAAGYIPEFDHSNMKLKMFTPVKIQAAHTHVNTLTLTKGKFASFAAGDIKGSANTDSEDDDQDSAPTNSALVHALATCSDAGAVTLDTFVSPGLGRNLCAVLKATVGAITMEVGDVAIAITGTYKGAAQTETITFAFTDDPANNVIAQDKFRYLYGDKPFDTVTAATVTGLTASQENLQVSLGIGSKIALPVNLKTPAEADVTNIYKNAANLSPSGIVDATNMTVNLGVLADGDDFNVVYSSTKLSDVVIGNVAGGAIAAAAASEVANTTDLSAVTVRVAAIGY